MGEPRKRYKRRKRIRLEDFLNDSTSSSAECPPHLDDYIPPHDPAHSQQPAPPEEGGSGPLPYDVNGPPRPSTSRPWVPKPTKRTKPESLTEVVQDTGPQNEGGLQEDEQPLEVGTDNESSASNVLGEEDHFHHASLTPSEVSSDYDDAAVFSNGSGDVEPENVAARREEDSDVEEEEEDTTLWTVNDATRHLYSVKIKHNISDRAFAASWSAFRQILPVLQAMPPEALPSASTIKRHAMQDLPQFRLEIAHRNRETGEDVTERNLEKFPVKKYEVRSAWQPLYEVWRAALNDVCDFHRSLHHGSLHPEVLLNVDGVPIGRTGRSQIIVSMKFTDCRNVYQLVNAIPYEDGKKLLSVTFLIGAVVKDLQRLGLDLKLITADAPMRAFLRNQKSHSGRMACDYCYGRARHEKKPIWGLTTINQEPRSMPRLLQDYEEHDLTGRPLADYGYRAKCELLELIPGFDFINGIPVDPMHLLYLGIARCLFELLFQVGEARVVNDKSVRRVPTEELDSDLVQQRVPSEVNRRPRPMDYKNWKASEWRSLVLYFFPLVVSRLQKGLRRQMWLEFSYLSRAYTLEENSFQKLNPDDLDKLTKKWYRNYHHLFGSNNMRYNIHLFLHLDRIRIHGPFSTISAFPFEGSFAASGRAQRPGTHSVGLQSMRASYLRPREGHVCKKSYKYRSHTTPRSDDTLVYTKEGIFKIVEEPVEVSQLVVKRVITTTYFPELPTKLDFEAVGVNKYLYVSDLKKSIHVREVLGKVIAVELEDKTVLVKVSDMELQEAD